MLAGAQTTFLLNDRDIATDVPRGMAVLDFLRREQGLIGTKEGCKEGDCGACMVLIGRLQDGDLVYRPETSCLIPVGELQGKHLVTIEGLNLDDLLSPVQEAVVAEGGTQCGFCTPGIVLSMTHALMTRRGALTTDDVRRALGGHLCRCTGYASLLRAGRRLEALWDDADRGADDAGLESWLSRLVEMNILPVYFQDVPRRLRSLADEDDRVERSDEGDPVVLAGGTDLYVQRGEELADTDVVLSGAGSGRPGIRGADDMLDLDAGVTFEQVAEDAAFRRLVSGIEGFMDLMASAPIRSRATLGGNVVNASPIGDMTILLLALGADIVLRGPDDERRLPLRDFFLGYKQLALETGERVLRFTVPVTRGDTHVHFEKVSKRKHLDIATVNSAIRLALDNDVVVDCGLSLGGVAPIPKYCVRSSEFLCGRQVTEATVKELADAVQEEITPISDVRGSAEYKRLLARQLVAAHFVSLFPNRIHAEMFL